MPQKAHAFLGIGDIVADFLTEVETTITGIFTGISSVATDNLWVKDYVLDPAAWAIAQSTIQSIAGSSLKFVIGGGKGGSPLVVSNILGHYQRVADNQALAFFGQISAQYSNDPANPNYSPFASAVLTSVRVNYSKGTSLAGFFASSQCTLKQYSPNIDQFINGNFTQGAWGAWFALTTEDQNNPFTLQQRAWNQTLGLISDSKSSHLQQLSWNQGLLSWCGSDSSGDDGSGSASGPSPECTNKDGTEGRIQTPGTFIVSGASKVLGAGVDKLVAADEIDETLGQIATQFVVNAISGPGGLLAASQSVDGRPSAIDNYLGDSSTSGGGNTLIQQAVLYAQKELGVTDEYEAAWNTIGAAATKAGDKVSQLIAQFQTGQATTTSCQTSLADAQAALQTEINPLILSAQSAIASASSTRALALKFLNEVAPDPNSTSAPVATSTATQDAAALAAAHPNESDLADVKANAMTFSSDPNSPAAHSAPPPQVLKVSGGSLVDQMNLIAVNAQQALDRCFAQTQSP